MTQLSLIDSQFDRFLFAPLHENSETPLSVFSALVRQDIDPWQEAARLAQLPKDHGINSLAATIWKSDSERWSPSDASIAAARLIKLLPSHDESRRSAPSADTNGGIAMMWLVYGIILGSIAITGSIHREASWTSDRPSHAAVVAAQGSSSQPPQAPGSE